ncbi:MAG TPA: hypothetical protein DEA96_13135 [Leptospiraceae bacterium]|nr:hypothetical protein [Spirochaetaceae bacterium]HBS05906.1 hypothetical protein [Leptospiraceae bacterium]|tara:strand:+ start:35257 stop:35706 length:450 start_codon:yes stop_codon:yes gene_type:complete
MKSIWSKPFWLLLVLASSALWALPPMQSPVERARNSDVVIHAVVTAQQQTSLNSVISAVQLSIIVRDVLKAPESFNARRLKTLNFLVTPNSYESGLREAPGPGEWLIFLRLTERTVDNRVYVIPVLSSPEAFSFHPFDAAQAAEIRKLP